MFKDEKDMIEFERIDKKELTGFPKLHFFICLCKTKIMKEEGRKPLYKIQIRQSRGYQAKTNLTEEAIKDFIEEIIRRIKK